METATQISTDHRPAIYPTIKDKISNVHIKTTHSAISPLYSKKILPGEGNRTQVLTEQDSLNCPKFQIWKYLAK